jgi:hypothetical protein
VFVVVVIIIVMIRLSFHFRLSILIVICGPDVNAARVVDVTGEKGRRKLSVREGIGVFEGEVFREDEVAKVD